MKTNSVKRSLIASLIVLVICLSTFIGTTFAWFTDEATSSGNVIQAGTLELKFEKWNGTDWADAEEGPIFNYDKWEPGYTQIVDLRLRNVGSLAFKWQAIITTEKSLSILADVINVYVKTGDSVADVQDYVAGIADRDYATEAANGNLKKYTLRQFINETPLAANGVLNEKNDEVYMTVVLQMDTGAGNEYQGLDLGGKFDFKILATQNNFESDSIDPNYDAAAPFYGSTVAPAPQPSESAIEADVKNDKDEKIGSLVVPTEALEDKDSGVIINIQKTDYVPNFTVDADSETKTFDITVSNLKAGNEELVKVALYIGMNLDPATVKVYHYDTEITNATYDPYKGYVTFYTTDFSPFTLVYDEESVYVPEVVNPDVDPAPEASVEASPENVGVELPWGNYGQWSPNYDVDENPKLEAAYVFSCTETLDEAKLNAYANWYCDFYVKLDTDLGENEIFLGGNYGSFGWVGFHNGDLTLEANTEIPLLGSVTNGNWTYLDVVQNVGTFICGVGDVDDALDGATFTVSLRLTNPEKTSETIDVAVINYVFGTVQA